MRDALRFGPFPHDGAWRTGASAALTAVLLSAVGILMLNDGRSHAEAVMAGAFAAALALALLLSPLWHDRGLQEALIAAAGALLVGASLRSVSAGGLGWGDVKMMAFVGAVVGAPAVVLAGLVTALLGGVGALLMIVTGRVTRHTRIP